VESCQRGRAEVLSIIGSVAAHGGRSIAKINWTLFCRRHRSLQSESRALLTIFSKEEEPS